MANEYIRKEWAGGVVRTTLNGAINSTATAITVTDGSSFPSGVKPFVLVIDRGTATEEKIICSSRTGNNLTVLQRGYDGSSGQAHSSGAYIEHALDAYTVDQANAIAATMTTQGDIVYKTVTGDNTSFGRLAIGTTGYPLVSGGTAPAYQQLGQTGIASTAVTAAKINSDVAGTGLVKDGTTGALNVNVDGSTLEVVSDTVRVKDGGITSAKIFDGTIVDLDINAAAAIQRSKLALTGTLIAADFAASAKPVVICTASPNTRPSTPVEGQIIYETDTDRIYVYDGTAWILLLAKGTYTPALTGMAVGTGGYNSANWNYVNGKLFVSGRIEFGTSGTTFPTSPTIGFPSGFTAEFVAQEQSTALGQAWVFLSTNYVGQVALETSTTFKVVVHRYDPTLAALAYVNHAALIAGVPGTWAAGAKIRYTLAVVGTMT